MSGLSIAFVLEVLLESVGQLFSILVTNEQRTELRWGKVRILAHNGPSR
jgi:hypothetical protein